MEHKRKNDILPKKQVHMYVYSDVERILKAFGIKPSEFLTLNTIELLSDKDLGVEFQNNNSKIEKLKEKIKNLEKELELSKKQLTELEEQNTNIKLLMNKYVPTEDPRFTDSIKEVLKLVNDRVTSEKRLPYIYYDDVIAICEKHNVDYQFVLSKIDKDVLNTHFKLRFKK